jgi:hypothetical protein
MCQVQSTFHIKFIRIYSKKLYANEPKKSIKKKIWNWIYVQMYFYVRKHNETYM